MTLKGIHGQNLLNPFAAAQNFNYKISNFMDKLFVRPFFFLDSRLFSGSDQISHFSRESVL